VGGPVRGDLVVRAKLMGAVFEGSPPVRARLVANGTAVAAFVCEKQGPAEHVFRIPGHLVPESGALDLAIEVANPRSPRQHGLNDDPRLLGVGVWSLAISESRAER
jgi:hypothetical protein